MQCTDVDLPKKYSPRPVLPIAVPLSILIPAGDDPLAYNDYRFVIPDGQVPALAKAELEDVPQDYGKYDFSGILCVKRNDGTWDDLLHPADAKNPEKVLETDNHEYEIVEGSQRVAYIRIRNAEIANGGAKITSVCMDFAAQTEP